MTDASVRILPILDEHLPEVCSFWQENFASPCPVSDWISGFSKQWHPAPPNHGFMLRSGEELVGAFGAFYSIQVVNGVNEQFCNMTSLFVLPEFRSNSLALIRTLLRQPGFHLTAFSANQVAARIYLAMGFSPLEWSARLFPALGLPWPVRADVLVDFDQMYAELTPERRKVCEDHRQCHRVLQVAFGNRLSGYCHVIWRKGSSKGIPCANILDVSDAELFGKFVLDIQGYFLWQHGCLLVRCPSSVKYERRFLSVVIQEPQVGFYKSSSLRKQDIGILYSELVAICGC